MASFSLGQEVKLFVLKKKKKKALNGISNGPQVY